MMGLRNPSRRHRPQASATRCVRRPGSERRPAANRSVALALALIAHAQSAAADPVVDSTTLTLQGSIAESCTWTYDPGGSSKFFSTPYRGGGGPAGGGIASSISFRWIYSCNASYDNVPISLTPAQGKLTVRDRPDLADVSYSTYNLKLNNVEDNALALSTDSALIGEQVAVGGKTVSAPSGTPWAPGNPFRIRGGKSGTLVFMFYLLDVSNLWAAGLYTDTVTVTIG